MEIIDYFSPIHIKKDLNIDKIEPDDWIRKLTVYENEFPDLENKKIAIIGITSKEFPNEANILRSFIYKNKRQDYAASIVDLGNIEIKSYDIKTYEKIGFILSELIQIKVIPLILGLSQELTFSQYLAFEYLKKTISLCIMDSKIDFQIEDDKKPGTESFLHKILLKDPSYLFNLSHLGFQTYLTETDTISLLDKYHFDLYRLGLIKEKISDSEPLIRSSEIVSFDLSSIKQGDSPGSNNPSPNGLTAYEACKISQFTGISDNIQSLAFYEYNSLLDSNFQTARLLAQMIWYFMDGMTHKTIEKVIGNKERFLKYITEDKNNKYQIVFYKSKKSNRWWMEVPIAKSKKQLKDKQIIPCSYEDYSDATKGEIPVRWWKALKKLT